MKKKMVHGLLIPVAHTTPINHNDAPLPEIVHGFHHPRMLQKMELTS
jgi:hypothetical protein